MSTKDDHAPTWLMQAAPEEAGSALLAPEALADPTRRTCPRTPCWCHMHEHGFKGGRAQ